MPIDEQTVNRLMECFAGEVYLHSEFVHVGGKAMALMLPVVIAESGERLLEIQNYFGECGGKVQDVHNYFIDHGGMRELDCSQLVLKRQTDPQGLLNPRKSIYSGKVRHMSDEELERLCQ